MSLSLVCSLITNNQHSVLSTAIKPSTTPSQECDSDGSGVVEVSSLIEYIRKVQLGDQSSSTDEVYDSEEDVS